MNIAQPVGITHGARGNRYEKITCYPICHSKKQGKRKANHRAHISKGREKGPEPHRRESGGQSRNGRVVFCAEIDIQKNTKYLKRERKGLLGKNYGVERHRAFGEPHVVAG